MPAAAPNLDPQLVNHLRGFGERIRAERKLQKVSAVVVAEAAGLSRVTVHRIERGEPSVTMGAYLSVMNALGLQLAGLPMPEGQKKPVQDLANEVIELDRFPQLRLLAWSLPGTQLLDAATAFALYERHWRHVEPKTLEPAERALVERLKDQFGKGRLLV